MSNIMTKISSIALIIILLAGSPLVFAELISENHIHNNQNKDGHVCNHCHTHLNSQKAGNSISFSRHSSKYRAYNDKAWSCQRCGGNGKCYSCSGTGKHHDSDCYMCSGTGTCYFCSGRGNL
jgi:hypothetical protein